MKFIRAVAACLIGLVSGAVLADGVRLFVPGPPIPADHPWRATWQRSPEFVAAHPLIVNKAAFGANFLIVEVNGREHYFIGSMVNEFTWIGQERSAGPGLTTVYGRLVLSKFPAHEVSGYMSLPSGHRFDIASSMLVESIGN